MRLGERALDNAVLQTRCHVVAMAALRGLRSCSLQAALAPPICRSELAGSNARLLHACRPLHSSTSLLKMDHANTPIKLSRAAAARIIAHQCAPLLSSPSHLISKCAVTRMGSIPSGAIVTSRPPSNHDVTLAAEHQAEGNSGAAHHLCLLPAPLSQAALWSSVHGTTRCWAWWSAGTARRTGSLLTPGASLATCYSC